MEPASTATASTSRREVDPDVTRTVTMLVGIAFLAVGVAGFIPGITSNLDDIEFAGHESGAELLGVFQVSILHNVVHLLFGVAGLAFARSARSAKTYLVVGGAIYLVLWIYGLVVDHDHDANFVPFDDADDWLHFGLGVVMIALGVLLPGVRSARTASGRPDGAMRP